MIDERHLKERGQRGGVGTQRRGIAVANKGNALAWRLPKNRVQLVSDIIGVRTDAVETNLHRGKGAGRPALDTASPWKYSPWKYTKSRLVQPVNTPSQFSARMWGEGVS